MTTPATDAEIVTRSGAHPAAFGELFERHAASVHRFLARRGGAQLADDLLGEVFAQALGARSRYDPTYADARPWLLGFAHNAVRKELRSRGREGRALLRLPPGDAEDPYGAADDRLVAGAGHERVLRELDRLPERERELLLLVAWDHLTPTEAARVLTIPAGTARRLLHTARTLLRDRMATDDGVVTEDLPTHDLSAQCAVEER